MKTICLLFVTICSLGLVAAADPQPPIGATATLDREIAIVERTPIWQSELDELLARVPAQNFDPNQKKAALDSLIDTVLIQHTAAERKIETSDAEIDAAVKQVETQNNIDDAGLDKALADQHFTRAQYREELGRQLRAQRVFQQIIAPKVSVTEAEIATEWAKHSKDAPTSEQHEQVRQALWSNKMGAATTEWLAKRRAGAHIEVKP
jgi:parvulin-like peptidyl-prolyl isomerase